MKKIIIILILIVIIEAAFIIYSKPKEKVCIKYGMVCIKNKNGLYQENKVCGQYAIVEDEK